MIEDNDLVTETTPQPTIKVRYKPRYLCKSKVKEMALQVAKNQLGPTRSKMFTRVGSSFFEYIDGVVANAIVNRVKSQPSKGKTLT